MSASHHPNAAFEANRAKVGCGANPVDRPSRAHGWRREEAIKGTPTRQLEPTQEPISKLKLSFTEPIASGPRAVTLMPPSHQRSCDA